MHSDSTLSALSIDEAFQGYIDICNRAIDVHKNKYPYREIWSAGALALQGTSIYVAVSHDSIQNIFLIIFSDYHIQVSDSLVEEALTASLGKVDGNQLWNVDYNHILAALQQPDYFIDNPTLLKWDWMLVNQGDVDFKSAHGKDDEQALQQ